MSTPLKTSVAVIAQLCQGGDAPAAKATQNSESASAMNFAAEMPGAQAELNGVAQESSVTPAPQLTGAGAAVADDTETHDVSILGTRGPKPIHHWDMNQCTAAEQGPNVLLCMPNGTKCILREARNAAATPSREHATVQRCSSSLRRRVLPRPTAGLCRGGRRCSERRRTAQGSASGTGPRRPGARGGPRKLGVSIRLGDAPVGHHVQPGSGACPI
jgi:hypothetical protein